MTRLKTVNAIKHSTPSSLRSLLRRHLFRYQQARLWHKSGERWWLDSVAVEDGSLEINGWALAAEGKRSRVGFTINDRPFGEIAFPLDREDVGRAFPYVTGARYSGFRCRVRIGREAAFQHGCAEFRYIDRSTGEPWKKSYPYYYFDPLEGPELPDGARRARVHGNTSESEFRAVGSTVYMRLGEALRKTAGKDYRDFSRILDWGCGCGRLTRYLRELHRASITGMDIDADNIGWCSRNLDFARFLHVPLHPPAPVADGSYDLLIGLSVFSHLGEKEQFEWLAELHRMAAPGAMLLLTVHGDMSAARSPAGHVFFNHFRKAGFVDVGTNSVLKDFIEQPDYYRDAYHTQGYIKRNWGRYFGIVAILPAYVGHQDLVVMRKR